MRTKKVSRLTKLTLGAVVVVGFFALWALITRP